MALVSAHAKQRVDQRIGQAHDAQALLDWLWKRGREARLQDFQNFQTDRRPGRDYRVAVRKGALYLVVRDTVTNRYITLMKRSEAR